MTPKSKKPSSIYDDERIKALHRYNILDTPTEHEFDNITKLAKLICNAPIALISLVDEERLFFKSILGTEAKPTPLEVSFSARTVLEDGILEVEDALLDERFKNHPSVLADPFVRSYAGAPLIDEDGYRLGVIGVFDTVPKRLSDAQKEGLQTLAQQVITHLSLKKRGIELDAKTQHFEDLLNISAVSPEIHCILDFEGKIQFINNAVTTLLEYTVEEALGMSMWEVCYREDISRVTETIEAGLREHIKQFNIDFRIVSRSGMIRWMSWNMVSKNQRWYTYGRDITENKRVESELMKLSFVASKVNNAVVINDANNHVTWVNDAFEKITGFSLDDLKGRRLGDLIVGPQTDMELLDRAREFSRQNKSFTVDLLSYRKDKQPIWLSIYNTVILDDKGKVELEIEIIIDITDKKLAEKEMLDAKEQALQLSEAKEMFLSVMSHEIRTPLNAIIGMTHILLDNDPKESQLNDLNILKFSGENLLHIINDILDFTKIETGNLKFDDVAFNLHTLAGDSINSLQVNAQKKNITLSLIYDPNLPEEIIGDRTRLYQILMNLLGNSIKFTEQGQVDLHISLQNETKDLYEILFEVKDTGIGIPEDKLSYIFETFTQAKTDISRQYGGTGLGLAITKKLLKLYGSDIFVSSQEGKGSTFSFAINFKKLDGKPYVRQPVQNMPMFSNKKILIVDDNEINILIATRIISKWGFSIDTAYTGDEAIEMIKTKVYDLIFMDIKMPGMDGFEATQVIRSLPDPYFKNLPVIALTASSLDDEHSKFNDSGMNGHILKPFNLEELRALLAKFLS